MTPTEILPLTTIVVMITVVKQTLTSLTTEPSVMAMPTVKTTEKTENQELSTHRVKRVAKRTTPKRNVILERKRQTKRLLGTEDRWNKIKINNKTHRSKSIVSVQAAALTLNKKCHVFTPGLHVTDRRLPNRQDFH